MRGALVGLLVASLALAGCSGGKGGDGHGDGDADASPDGPAGNSTALAARIQVSVNGTALAPANGTVTADRGVALTFDASASTGAILTYSWDFGDNGTSSDRQEEHTYAEPGNYTVRLEVANGNLTANATLQLTVAGTLGGAPLFTSHQEFTGSLPLGNPNSPTTADTDYVDHVVAVASADANGTAALAVVARIAASHTGAPVNEVFVYWTAPDGTELAAAGDIGDTDGEHAITYEGPMPAGDYTLRVRLFFGAASDYTATVDLDYVTA